MSDIQSSWFMPR